MCTHNHTTVGQYTTPTDDISQPNPRGTRAHAPLFVPSERACERTLFCPTTTHHHHHPCPPRRAGERSEEEEEEAGHQPTANNNKKKKKKEEDHHTTANNNNIKMAPPS